MRERGGTDGGNEGDEEAYGTGAFQLNFI